MIVIAAVAATCSAACSATTADASTGTNVLVRLKQHQIHFGTEQAAQGHGGRYADAHTQTRDLNLGGVERERKSLRKRVSRIC